MDKFIAKAAEGAVETRKLFIAMQFIEHGALFEHRFKKVPFPSDPSLCLEGIIDIYDPVREWLYDLKVSTSAIGDRRQLLTYAIGVQAQGFPVRGGSFLYPLMKRKKEVGGPILAEEIAEHEHNMVTAYREIKAGYEPVATKGPKCGFCDFNGSARCPATYKRSSDYDFGNRKDGTFDVSLSEDIS